MNMNLHGGRLIHTMKIRLHLLSLSSSYAAKSICFPSLPWNKFIHSAVYTLAVQIPQTRNRLKKSAINWRLISCSSFFLMETWSPLLFWGTRYINNNSNAYNISRSLTKMHDANLKRSNFKGLSGDIFTNNFQKTVVKNCFQLILKRSPCFQL